VSGLGPSPSVAGNLQFSQALHSCPSVQIGMEFEYLFFSVLAVIITDSENLKTHTDTHTRFFTTFARENQNGT
jgi:hypothetical protein